LPALPFSNRTLSKIHNLSWIKSIFSEPPENLPVAEGLGEEDKKEINFFLPIQF